MLFSVFQDQGYAVYALDSMRTRGEPLVLGYHRVVEDCGPRSDSAPAMFVSARTLERQLEWVGRRFQFVSLDELGPVDATVVIM